MLALIALHCAKWVGSPSHGVVGLKPPWNQPHVMLAELSSSPMFLPLMPTTSPVVAWLLLAQSSYAGWGSPMTVPVVPGVPSVLNAETLPLFFVCGLTGRSSAVESPAKYCAP